MDLGVPESATSADVDEMYRREIAEDSSFKKQGRMCKLGAWYDFIRACDEWTKHVAARRYHMLMISENLMGAGKAQATNSIGGRGIGEEHRKIRGVGSHWLRSCRRQE